MPRVTVETITSRVERALRTADDFMTATQLAKQLGGVRVHSALWELRHYQVVDCLESEGTLFWFALPKEQDTRLRVVEERVPESTPRKRKKAPSRTGT